MNTDYNKFLKMFNSLMGDIKVLKIRQNILLKNIRKSIEINRLRKIKENLNK